MSHKREWDVHAAAAVAAAAGVGAGLLSVSLCEEIWKHQPSLTGIAHSLPSSLLCDDLVSSISASAA